MLQNGYGSLNRTLTVLYNGITTSIAFYPAIITFFYMLLVFGMLQFDYSKAAQELSQEMPWLKFSEVAAIRAILTTLIAGILSLMALSFSMVMVVLNQATNTISPKVMQGLITRKEHQFVLGNQFGTIVYFVVLLLLVRGIDYFKIPVFTISLGLVLGFWSLSLFVYFIHSISQNIQVTNIVSTIHNDTFEVLKRLKEKAKPAIPEPEKTFNLPYTFLTDKPGYFQEVNVSSLQKIAEKHQLQLKIEPELTEYVPCGAVLFRANVAPDKIPEKDLKHLYASILYFDNENVKVNHVYGFTQLAEIAIKSLSPGINDPGIAVICVQYLSNLFVNLYDLDEKEVYANQQQQPWLWVRNVTFEPLLNRTLGPIRHYGRQDESVLRALLHLVWVVGQEDFEKRRYQNLLRQHAQAIVSAANEVLNFPPDAAALNQLIGRMQETCPDYFELEKIKV